MVAANMSSNQRASISAEGSELMMELFNRMPVEALKNVPEPIAKRVCDFMVANGYRIVFGRWCLQAEPKGPERGAPPKLLAAEINALPQRVRDYIHDLETDADPAGDKWQLAAARENTAALAALLSERQSPEEPKAVQCVWRSGCRNHRICDEIGCCQQLGAAAAEEPSELVCYSPCALHVGLPFMMSVGYARPIRTICPICNPPKSVVTAEKASAAQCTCGSPSPFLHANGCPVNGDGEQT